MTMDPATENSVKRALRAVLEAAQKAHDAGDLGSARQALSRVWFTVHDATNTLNAAEEQTRSAALARIGERA